jgi:hypothetical protein
VTDRRFDDFAAAGGETENSALINKVLGLNNE